MRQTVVSRRRSTQHNSESENFRSPHGLVVEPPPMAMRHLREARASTLSDGEVGTMLLDIDGSDQRWDRPWSLYGVTLESKPSGDQWGLETLVHSGTGHPVDTFCGFFTSESTLGLILTLETKQPGSADSTDDTRWAIAVLADGRTQAIMTNRNGGPTKVSDPPTGRLVDAMLTLLDAPVPLRVDPRELALDLVIDASRLYPDGTSLLGLALSDPVALSWLPEEDDETAEHWTSGERLDSIEAYDALGEEIERRLSISEDDWLPPEIVDRFTREVGALAVSESFAVRSTFYGRGELLDWLSPNAIVNEYAQQISHRKQPNANRSVSNTVSRMVQDRRRRWDL